MSRNCPGGKGFVGGKTGTHDRSCDRGTAEQSDRSIIGKNQISDHCQLVGRGMGSPGRDVPGSLRIVAQASADRYVWQMKRPHVEPDDRVLSGRLGRRPVERLDGARRHEERVQSSSLPAGRRARTFRSSTSGRPPNPTTTGTSDVRMVGEIGRTPARSTGRGPARRRVRAGGRHEGQGLGSALEGTLYGWTKGLSVQGRV